MRSSIRKLLGVNLSGPIVMLKAANVHVLHEEWDEAPECRRRLRRDIGG